MVSLGDGVRIGAAKANGLKGGVALQAIHEYRLNQKCVCRPTRAIA